MLLFDAAPASEDTGCSTSATVCLMFGAQGETHKPVVAFLTVKSTLSSEGAAGHDLCALAFL